MVSYDLTLTFQGSANLSLFVGNPRRRIEREEGGRGIGMEEETREGVESE